VRGAEADDFVAESLISHGVDSRTFRHGPGETVGGVELPRVGGVDFFEEAGEEGLEAVASGGVFGERVQGFGAESVAEAVAAGVRFTLGGDGSAGSGSIGARCGDAGWCAFTREKGHASRVWHGAGVVIRVSGLE
jgi:hypothetical protein